MSSPAIQGQPLDERQRRRDAMLLFVLALLVYNANCRVIGASDTYPARFLPFAILEHGTIYLDSLGVAAGPEGRQPYWLVHDRRGHLVSTYPIVTPLLVTPLYLPVVAWRHWSRSPLAILSIAPEVMEKVAASIVASAMAAWSYLLLRRRAPRRDALLLAAALAFGTSTWMIGSQALWQHGVAELLVVAALWWLTGPPSAGTLAAAGAAVGLLAANRPPDALLAAALALLAFDGGRRRHLPAFVAAAAAPLLGTIAYNLVEFGHVAGGYDVVGIGWQAFFSFPLLPGLAGLLLSPTRGLFVFSPFLLFLPAGVALLWRQRGERRTALCLSAGVLVHLLFYARTDWRAGASYGPRFLCDLLPVLVWLLVPVVGNLSAAGRVAFTLACAMGVAIQAIGAFYYEGHSDIAIFSTAGEKVSFAGAWDPRNAPFLFELRYPRPSLRFAHMLAGGGTAWPIGTVFFELLPPAPPVTDPRSQPRGPRDGDGLLADGFESGRLDAWSGAAGGN